MDTALRDEGGKGRKQYHRPKGPENKIRLITFSDYHDPSYSFYHFILFLYVLTILLLYTTYGCSESFPYGRTFVIASIAITALPVLLTFVKVATARRDHPMKCGVAIIFILLATAGSYGIFIYSDHCAAELIRFDTTVAELSDPRAKTNHYNLFTLRDGEVVIDLMFSGEVVVKGREVDCVVAPLASSAVTFNPQAPVGVWVADFAPRLELANWTLPIRQLVRADDNLQRSASTIIEKEAAKHNLTSTKEPQIFLWESFDTTPKFDRKSFVIAASVVYGLLGLNTLIPPIYFFFQHTRTATLEITEETYLLSHYT
jgi:hypothetical protein